MKRTCRRCKALAINHGYNPRCYLGHRLDYELEYKGRFEFGFKNVYPLEECPKPLTIKEYENIVKNKEY